jgi:hypothetical protein
MNSQRFYPCLTLVLIAGSLGAGCSKSNGTATSSGSHWLECDGDADCAPQGDDARCGAEGFCVDTSGRRIVIPPPRAGDGSGEAGAAGMSSGNTGGGNAGGTAGTGSAGTGGAGTGGSRCPPQTAIPASCRGCNHGSCGVPACRDGGFAGVVCPEDGEGGSGGGSVDAGVGVVLPDCMGISDGAGTTCSGRDDQPIPECCANSRHLRCTFMVCTQSFPAMCSGNWQAVSGSQACGGYAPCGGKSCGDSCTVCEPGDTDCSETAEVKACTGGGDCISAALVDCVAPDPCDLGSDTCAAGQTCCAVGRCGPVVTDQGVCEPADPSSGNCMPCACESQPGGCPICNSPDTPIATPLGDRPIAELREGDLVLSLHRGALVAVPVIATRQALVHDHAVVRVALDNGSTIEVSGSHPTAQGIRLDTLAPGDAIGDVRVLAVELIPYAHDRTYDILPASDSGSYLAGGALLGSTLAR